MTKTAKISIILAVIIFLMPFSIYLFEDYIGAGIFHLLLYLLLVVLFIIIIGKSIGQTKIESNNFRQNAHLWIPIIIVGLSLLIVFFPGRRNIGTPYYINCRNQLRGIYVGLEFYKTDKNKYPEASRWCDLLSEKYVLKDRLICPAKWYSGERGSYAINPDCEPNSPRDVVLLFEGKKTEWNLYGGAELIDPEIHSVNNWFWGYSSFGCNILFNDGEVKFVAAKDFKKLKWK